MRKQTKLVAVLSAAALLAIGASMTSYAAKGWNDLGNGDWEYLDSDGERVTGEWRRSSGGFCFLDDDGLMARNRLITPDESNDNDDNYYYVNDTGERRKNAWARVENEDDDEVNDQEVSVLYYYLGSNGKAYKAEEKDGTYKKVTINWQGQDKTFFFDENARMVSGWVKAEDSPNGKVYYCGDEIEGYAYTDWHLLDVPDFISDNEPADDPYEPAEYFCFESNGKMRQGKPGEPKVWYDNGWYYTFDENGVYQDDWYKVTLATENNVVATENTVNAYSTYSGIEKKAGWVYAENDAGDNKWYYLVAVRQGNDTARNVPFNSIASGDNASERAKLINKKTYVFDEEGIMLDGLQIFENDLPEDKLGGAQSKKLDAGIYYFSKDSATKGQMLTGRQSVTEDGETDDYYFAKDGHAYTNTVINDIVYGDDGKRVQAEDGNKYEIVYVEEDAKLEDKDGNLVVAGDSYIVVNARGKMVKTTASSNGKRVKIDDSDYIVTVDENKKWSCTLAPEKN